MEPNHASYRWNPVGRWRPFFRLRRFSAKLRPSRRLEIRRRKRRRRSKSCCIPAPEPRPALKVSTSAAVSGTKARQRGRVVELIPAERCLHERQILFRNAANLGRHLQMDEHPPALIRESKAYREKELAKAIRIYSGRQRRSRLIPTLSAAARCESCDWDSSPSANGNFYRNSSPRGAIHAVSGSMLLVGARHTWR